MCNTCSWLTSILSSLLLHVINLPLHNIAGSHDIKEKTTTARAPACYGSLCDREISQEAVLRSYKASPPTLQLFWKSHLWCFSKVHTWGMAQVPSWRSSAYIKASFFHWQILKARKRKKEKFKFTAPMPFLISSVWRENPKSCVCSFMIVFTFL